jgi:hypothetical protein
MQTADPHIVATSIKGWTLAREATPSTPYKASFGVDGDGPSKKPATSFLPSRRIRSMNLKGDGDGCCRLTIDRSPFRAG